MLRGVLSQKSDVEVVGEVNDGAHALQKLSVITPNVLLIGVSPNMSDDIRAIEQITLQYPNVSVIVLSEHKDWYYVREYMRAGAKDYLYMPVTNDVLVSTVHDVYNTNRKLHERNTVAALNDEFVHKSRVFTFVSTKGGVGKTTVAINVAAAWAKLGKSVVVVDLDLQSGVDNIFLGLTPARTIADLVRECTDIDPEALKRYLIQHESGLSLLCAPIRPEEMELVSPAHVRVVLQILKKMYDYVIVDTSPVVNDNFFTTYEVADECFLVHTLNLTVIKNNRVLLDLLEELGYQTDKVKHVVNRNAVRNGMKISDLHQIFQKDVFWSLDNDYSFVEQSINQGIPFVLKEPHHRLSKQVYSFVTKLDTLRGSQPSRRGLIRAMFSRKR